LSSLERPHFPFDGIVHHALLADEFLHVWRLAWHFARPPVQGLDFEVDVRDVVYELVI
jgi:hypothetical protein